MKQNKCEDNFKERSIGQKIISFGLLLTFIFILLSSTLAFFGLISVISFITKPDLSLVITLFRELIFFIMFVLILGLLVLLFERLNKKQNERKALWEKDRQEFLNAIRGINGRRK